MVPILYATITEGTVPTDFGLGCLTDAIKCEVTEVRNSVYELELTYAAQGIHAEDIEPGRWLKAKPNYTDNPQLFEIYQVSKTMNGRFTVNARHDSYLLSDKVITSGTAASCTAACLLLTGAAGNFTITTDKTVSADFAITEPSSVRSWFGGKTGSILDVYGPGEWHYDNFSAEFKAARGQDRGVTIRYGKNLTELSQTLDMTNLASAVIPYYKAQDGTITTGSAVSTGLVGITREIAVDFSAGVDPESVTPITTQLATLATAYISKNNFTTIKNSITLDFIQLKDLSERVDLCDTVHIYFEPLGITATAKCVETVWDVLAERYVSTTFGDPKTNISDTIIATQKAVEEKPSTTVMQQAIDQATELITGNLGGYVVLHDSNGDGEPDEILIMDTADIATATSVWRWNKQGLGFSPNGYAGPYNAVAIDMLGQISASAITTGTLNANLIKAGVISDVQNNSSIDMANGAAKMRDFDAKHQFRLVSDTDVVKAVLFHNTGLGASFTLYDDSNQATAWMWSAAEGGYMGLADAAGTEVAAFNATGTGGGMHLKDSNGVDAVEAYVASNNTGHVDIQYNGDIFASLRTNTNGGVVDVYDQNYLNIQLIGNGGVVRCITVQQTSSRKVKENIKPMTDYKKILDLEAVSFDYKNKSSGTDKRGFIAEDVAEVLPNLVTPETEDMPAGLDYVGMIPYLQAVIKEQEKRIEALEKKINGK